LPAVDAVGALLAVFRLVADGVKLFSAYGTVRDMICDIFAVKQRLKPGVERQYGATVVFA